MISRTVCALILVLSRLETDFQASDPFEVHLAAVDEAGLAGCIKDAAESKWVTQKSTFHPGWKALGTSYQSNLWYPKPPISSSNRVNDLQVC